MDKQNLINEWNKLNALASKELNKHESFHKYNRIRLKMDKIEDILWTKYQYDIDNV